jgi:hypothetical protein
MIKEVFIRAKHMRHIVPAGRDILAGSEALRNHRIDVLNQSALKGREKYQESQHASRAPAGAHFSAPINPGLSPGAKLLRPFGTP